MEVSVEDEGEEDLPPIEEVEVEEEDGLSIEEVVVAEIQDDFIIAVIEMVRRHHHLLPQIDSRPVQEKIVSLENHQ